MASPNETQTRDSLPPVSAYKIISITNDTTHVDTSLTIEDSYRFNYLREDNFGLLPFSNVGRPYTKLVHEFDDGNIFPGFGAQARMYNFMKVEDIQYYNVPTPYTELFFKTVFEQGQILDALFTVNTSPNLNFSLAYKGVSSLGKYQHIRAGSNNFRATVSYQTPNDRYHLKAHFVSQKLLNEENGGLDSVSVDLYRSGNEEFLDRSRLEVNFEDAQNTLFGKRFFLKHSYQLIKQDSLSNSGISVSHILKYSDKEFHFKQENASPLFGPAYENVGLKDEVELRHLYNEASASYNSNILGKITAKAAHSHYNYGYNTAILLENDTIGNRLVGNMISAGGEYLKKIGGFQLRADVMLAVAGDFTGHNFEASLGYNFNEENRVLVSLRSNGQAPNFNFLLFQSDYLNYNWQNDFLNIKTKNLNFSLFSDRLLNVEANYTRINNYTYFGLSEDSFVKPMQHNGIVNYAKIKVQKELRWGQFALNNSILYQEVLDGENVLNLPAIVTRNTLYFSDYWFDKALYLQTGFTFHYFTNYNMNGYDPVLAEFYVQNMQEFEGFPTLDFFFNGKVQRTRIFFKLEHVNSLITGNNYFSAPKYPYRDFAVRFGLVWDFFL